MPTSALGSAGAKRRSQMTRQLSLQGTPPPVDTIPRRGLRRQQSDDISDKADLGLRIGSNLSAKASERNSRPVGRPKPVRLAWGDRNNAEHAGEGVEVVARRCEGLPRPTSRVVTRSPNYSLFEKEAPALTREQLAERLRRAWKSRGQKSNLDIFLAHSRPESATTARSDAAESDVTLYKPMQSIAFKAKPVGETKPTLFQERNKIDGEGMDTNENKMTLSELLDFKMFPAKDAELDKENVEVSAPNHLSASERRASFKSSHLVNKTITGSFSDGPDEDNERTEFKVFLTKAPPRPPLQRTSSAPTQAPTRPASPAYAKPAAKTSKPNPPIIRKVANVANYNNAEQEDSRDRSAARRKLKSTVIRRKVKDREESSDEDETCEMTSKKLSRRRQQPRGSVGSDIITMVSLVSPAESDVEAPELVTPPMIAALVEKVTAAEEAQQVLVEPLKEIQPQFILPNSAILRKVTKTVSFQSQPPVSRSCSANFPLRRVPPGAPIIIPPPITAPSTQILDKCAPSDNRGIKRRLVRAKTSPAKEDEENVSSDETCRTDTSSEPLSDPTTAVKVLEDGDEDSIDSSVNEPQLKSAKERECWVLYKRMLDKGVAVSYETILRGMLTPTEYRLRKSEQSRS